MTARSNYIIESEEIHPSIPLPSLPTSDPLQQYDQYWESIFNVIMQPLNNKHQLSLLLTLKSVVKKLLTREDVKHRTLDTTNPKVQERLLHIDGILELLYKLGFEFNVNNTLLTAHKVNHPIVLSCSTYINSKLKSLKVDAENKLNIATYKFHIGRFKEVDIHSEYLVFGYVRNVENKLSVRNIEYNICQICCIFYCIPTDKWDTSNMSHKFKLEDNLLRYRHIIDVGKYQSALLSNIVWYGKHHWRFRLSPFVRIRDQGLWFGIVNENNEFDEINCYHIGTESNGSYALNVQNGYSWCSNKKTEPLHKYVQIRGGWDHYIDMYVNFNKHSMSFVINNQHYTKTKTMRNLFCIEDSKYRVGFSCNNNVEIELVLYEINTL
eukprot:363595_1